ncbi:DUF559 domain-containing protein [Microbacterium sp. NPDC089321]|uniref:endonuclease domain-containing protein n=1 Tax=Microbacterium sp. NPDC089321 TaxID=3155183 RepID=UPI0034452A91
MTVSPSMVRMRHQTSLPHQLGERFSVADARALGVGRGRIRARDLARPFHGVRARRPEAGFLDRMQAYGHRMRPTQRLIGRSALRAWRLPFPVRWTPAEPLEVAAPRDENPPRTTGVKGRRLTASRATTWVIDGVAVVDPLAAVFSAAAELTASQVVVLLDAVMTTADNYPGLLPGRPVCTREQIESRLAEWGAFRGCVAVREALALARPDVESPKESETRVLLLAAGLPEPRVQYRELDGGRLVARIDLAYPECKVAIEYEGDGHRTEREQWRRDIQRQRELEDRGWMVIRLTQADLGHPDAVVDRIRRAIASRT